MQAEIAKKKVMEPTSNTLVPCQSYNPLDPFSIQVLWDDPQAYTTHRKQHIRTFCENGTQEVLRHLASSIPSWFYHIDKAVILLVISCCYFFLFPFRSCYFFITYYIKY